MGKCAGNVVIVITLVLCVIWILLISLPVGWHTKSTLIWNFHVGLYNVHVDKAIVGSAVGFVAGVLDFGTSRIRQKPTSVFSAAVGKITEGEESLRFYRDMFCNVAMLPIMNTNCGPWENLLWASWVMLLSTILTIIIMLSGAAFMYYYIYHRSRSKVRKWAIGLLATGPIINLMGLGVYTMLSFQFGHWLAELMITSRRVTFTFVYALALMVHLFTWAPILIAMTCGRMYDQEYMAEEMAWEKKKLLYGFDDEYGYPDEYDEFGNPRQLQYDEYGNSLGPGYGAAGSYHGSAYAEHEMVGYGSTQGDPYYGSYASYHDPYAQPVAPPSYQDPYAPRAPAYQH